MRARRGHRASVAGMALAAMFAFTPFSHAWAQSAKPEPLIVVRFAHQEAIYLFTNLVSDINNSGRGVYLKVGPQGDFNELNVSQVFDSTSECVAYLGRRDADFILYTNPKFFGVRASQKLSERGDALLAATVVMVILEARANSYATDKRWQEVRRICAAETYVQGRIPNKVPPKACAKIRAIDKAAAIGRGPGAAGPA